MEIITRSQEAEYNAGPKAPDDVIRITKLKPHYIYINFAPLKSAFAKLRRCINYTRQLMKIDRKHVCLLQYPIGVRKEVLPLLQRKQLIILLHDLTGLRENDTKVEKYEIKLFSHAKFIISHNARMTAYLVAKGIDENKIVNLEIFDYLCEPFEFKSQSIGETPTVAYAGNFVKAPFLKQLEQSKMNFELRLYGANQGFATQGKIVYMGKETPDKLPGLLDANLGLVWDGDVDDRNGIDVRKNYTRYNNPHKVSCYLCAGIPVVIWSQSAMADFVTSNNCGYLIDDLYDINDLDLSDYEAKKENAIKISQRLQEGYYTKRALNSAFEKMGLAEKIR